MGNPLPPGAGTTRLDPAVRSRARLMLQALQFAIIASIGVPRMVIGPDGGLLPLLAVGPAASAPVAEFRRMCLRSGAVAERDGCRKWQEGYAR
jgi:hypothetical protein